jgi:hypothetical protein
LALVIELILFAPATGNGEETAGFSVNVLAVVLNSVITAICVLPAIALVGLVFTWGYARSSPLGERLAGRLLGGDAARADNALVKAAKHHRVPAAPARGGPDVKQRPRAGGDDLEEGGAGGASTAEEARETPLRPHRPRKILVVPPPAGELSAGGVAAPAPSAPPAAAGWAQLWLPQLWRHMWGPGPPAQPPLQPLGLSGVAHHLTDEVIQLLRAKFAKYDMDNSGLVSTSELGTLMRDLGFTLSRRRLAALARELNDGDDDEGGEGINLAALVHWYERAVPLSPCCR